MAWRSEERRFTSCFDLSGFDSCRAWFFPRPGRELRSFRISPSVGGVEGDGLNEVRIAQAAEDSVGFGPFANSLPVLLEVELVGGVRSREEFEDRERDAPGVDLFEDLADGLLRILLSQENHRNHVGFEAVDHLFLERVPEHALLGVVLPEFVEALSPLAVPVQHRDRIHHRFVLLLLGGEVEQNVASDVSGDELVFAYREDRLLDVSVGGQRLPHVDVVPAFDSVFLGVLRVHRLFRQYRLVEGRDALLTVEYQKLRFRAVRNARALDGLRLEADFVVAGLEEHDGAYGE